MISTKLFFSDAKKEKALISPIDTTIIGDVSSIAYTVDISPDMFLNF